LGGEGAENNKTFIRVRIKEDKISLTKEGVDATTTTTKRKAPLLPSLSKKKATAVSQIQTTNIPQAAAGLSNRPFAYFLLVLAFLIN